jgi:hypothetical protein
MLFNSHRASGARHRPHPSCLPMRCVLINKKCTALSLRGAVTVAGLACALGAEFLAKRRVGGISLRGRAPVKLILIAAFASAERERENRESGERLELGWCGVGSECDPRWTWLVICWTRGRSRGQARKSRKSSADLCVLQELAAGILPPDSISCGSFLLVEWGFCDHG